MENKENIKNSSLKRNQNMKRNRQLLEAHLIKQNKILISPQDKQIEYDEDQYMRDHSGQSKPDKEQFEEIKQIDDLEQLWNQANHISKEEDVNESSKGQQSLNQSQMDEIFGQINGFVIEQNWDNHEDLQQLWQVIQIKKEGERSEREEVCEEIMIKNKIREEIQNEKCDYSRKLEMGKDYIVYNLKKYLTSKFKDKTHTYFGVQYSKSEGNSEKLFNPSTHQSILEVQKHPKCETIYFLVLTHNKQKIAMIEKCWLKKKKKQVMELKLFDDYEGRPGSTVAIIETYDGYYQEHCFCSTSITLPNQSPKSKDKLRYQISLQIINNRIVAHLGVCQIQNSAINCILFDDLHKNSFMMGVIGRYDEKVVCILKNGGALCPIVSFATFLSRKHYSESYGL